MRERPNILLIVIDTGRRERFGCYGYHRGTTPVIDELAGRGLVYDRMMATAPWTLPSHASLFTGLYTREHGADRPVYRMHEGITTLAQHLRAYGYEAAFFSNNPLISKRTGLTAGAGDGVPRAAFGSARRSALRRMKVLLGQVDRGAGTTNRAVGEFLRREARPFFVFINYMECHAHYRPPRAFERRFVRRRFTLIDSARHRLRMRQRLAADGAGWTADEAALLNDLYDASLSYVDARIGQLFDLLRRTSGRETVVIITADHGESLGDHGRFGHDLFLDQTLIHVPFITYIPGRAPARVQGLVQLTDVFGGVCSLVDVPIPPSLQDRAFSVDPFALEPDAVGRTYAFAESHEWDERFLQRRLARSPGFTRVPGAEAVLDERYKLVVERTTGAERLYDLQRDPGEQEDRLAELPAERQRLATALERWRMECRPAGTAAAPYSQEDERVLNARLEELGYL